MGNSTKNVLIGGGVLALLGLWWWYSKNNTSTTATPANTTSNTTTSNPTSNTTTPTATTNTATTPYTITISQNTYDSCGVGNNANMVSVSVTDDGTGFAASKTLTSNDFMKYNGIYAVAYNNQYRTVQCNNTNIATPLIVATQCPVSNNATNNLTFASASNNFM